MYGRDDSRLLCLNGFAEALNANISYGSGFMGRDIYQIGHQKHYPGYVATDNCEVEEPHEHGS